MEGVEDDSGWEETGGDEHSVSSGLEETEGGEEETSGCEEETEDVGLTEETVCLS